MNDIETAANDPAHGTLGIGEDGNFRIRLQRDLAHPVATVWQAITDPDRLATWLPGCRVDAQLGGQVLYDFGDEGAATGEITALQVPGPGVSGRLEHTWRWEGLPPSRVIWTLEPHGPGSRLVLVHTEVAPEPAAEFAAGWQMILDQLQSVL